MTTQPLDRHGRPTRVVALRCLATGAEYALPAEQSRWTVGSSPICEIRLGEPTVSKGHCTIERRTEHVLVIRDHQSTNGTFLDQHRVTVAQLCVGAVISLGRAQLLAVGGTARPARAAIEQLRGHDPVYRGVVEQALKIAASDMSVLVVGETGTGKDLIARVVHEHSRRATQAYVPVNCGAIPRELVAAELFGHERGAFTGATEARDGYFLQAQGGTLFLDELGELPLELQPNLLRVLENRTVRRVGGTHERAIDTRVVAATNRLELQTLRSDLYFRLATIKLALPALRERIGDLPELVAARLAEHAPTYGERRVADSAWTALASYRWPGNVRELMHAVDRAVVIGGATLTAADFLDGTRATIDAARTPGSDLRPYEHYVRGMLETALSQHGSIRAAAKMIGMPKSTFAEKARAWGLAPRGGKRRR